MASAEGIYEVGNVGIAGKIVGDFDDNCDSLAICLQANGIAQKRKRSRMTRRQKGEAVGVLQGQGVH